MSADYLRELLIMLEKVTNDLNEARKLTDTIENQYKVSKTEIKRLEESKDLILQKIMAEKKLIGV